MKHPELLYMFSMFENIALDKLTGPEKMPQINHRKSHSLRMR